MGQRLIIMALWLACASAAGCDLCAVSTANDAVSSAPTGSALGMVAADPPAAGTRPERKANRIAAGLSVGVLGEYRHASTLKRDGETVADAGDPFVDTSIVSLLVAWRAGAWGLRAYQPLILHRYRRDDGGEGWYAGNGDLLVEGTLAGRRGATRERFAAGTLFAGVEAPTGDTDQLERDAVSGFSAAGAPGHGHGGDPQVGAASAPPTTHSAVHPHDLMLGSGSWDFLVGASGFARWQRFYLTGHGQYTLRGEGTADYQVGDGVVFGGGPGVLLIDRDGATIGIHLNVSGELHQQDRQDGQVLPDSGRREIYGGPDLTLSWQGLTGEIGIELPVWQRNPGVQLSGNLKGHAGVNWRF